MKKISLRIFCAILIAGISLYGIYLYNQYDRKQLLNELEAYIESNRNQRTINLDFHVITDFDWDKVYFFRPYSDASIINGKLGFKWSKANLIKDSDSITLLVFVDENKVVEYLEFTSKRGYFIIPHDNQLVAGGTIEFRTFSQEESIE